MKRLIGTALCIAAVGLPSAAGADGSPSSPAMPDLAFHVARRAEALARRAAHHLDEARLEHDARRARCHDRVLSQTNALIRLLHHRLDQMDADPAPERHLAALGVLDRRLDEIDQELRVCNGEHLSAAPAGTRVVVTVSRDVPREDPTRVPEPRGRLPYLPPR